MIYSIQLNLFEQKTDTKEKPWIVSIGTKPWDDSANQLTSFSLLGDKLFSTQQEIALLNG
ncbi:hypothetical protein [Crocosphaera sp.]|uniref:hypothetical protein n=1 Tax=Crocosphaera sp. TaxID=2729996 RepID=UPI00262B30C4|nr:hypothetical protein [Crocosphaera sp.]MDJ0579088.1 hypothetical protein [Crocosphaera sp.]